MDSQVEQAIKEIDPAKKDQEWANRVVTALRMSWTHLVDPDRMRVNKEYLYSNQPMDKLEKIFKDKKFKELYFPLKPCSFMESIRNSIIEEITQNPPVAELRATDPTAATHRKDDIKMLKSRRILEEDISKYQTQIGLPPYKMQYSEFKGNAEQFDKLGLDEKDPEDVNFYEDNWQKLNYEISGQALVNEIMKINRWDEETTRRFVDDILAVRTVAFQDYVDQVTGEIKNRYIYPETVRGIFGSTNDGRDDECIGTEEEVTISEFLSRVGNDFNWYRDWKILIAAINYNRKEKYTGFFRGGVEYTVLNDAEFCNRYEIRAKDARSISWDSVYNWKVYVGYIEWSTWEATTTFLRNENDPDFVDVIPFGYQLEDHEEQTGYFKEPRYQQQKYKSHFLMSSTKDQLLFSFGKVYYQQISGAHDQYASGTLKYYREPGLSGVELVKTDIDTGNLAYWKMAFFIFKAKPEEDVYIWEELIQLTNNLNKAQKAADTASGKPFVENSIQAAIAYQQENSIRIRNFPKVDGKTIPNLPNLQGARQGIDPLASVMDGVVAWTEQKIYTKLGWNPMRSGMNPPSRESQQSEMNAVTSSQNATGYIYRMIQYAKIRAAAVDLTIAQDIIKFKESVPYKWILSLIGDENTAMLSALDEFGERQFAPHRKGVFFQDYNTTLDKQWIRQLVSQAVMEKTLDAAQGFMLTQTEDVKRAFATFTHMKRKTEKRLRKEAIEDNQMLDAMEQNKHNRAMELQNLKNQGADSVADKESNALMYSADKNLEGKIVTTDKKIDAEPDKIAAKTESQKDLELTKNNLQQQQFMGAAAGQ